MDYSLILVSNNASMDAEQPFLPIYESKQKLIGLILGPVLFFILLVVLPQKVYQIMVN